MDFTNCIADALNAVVPDKDFVCIVNSLRDKKFPVYVTHAIVVYSMDGSHKFYCSKTAHSKDEDKDTIMRGLVTELLSDIFTAFSGGGLVAKSAQLKY